MLPLSVGDLHGKLRQPVSGTPKHAMPQVGSLAEANSHLAVLTSPPGATLLPAQEALCMEQHDVFEGTAPWHGKFAM